MSVDISQKERRLSFPDYIVEGVASGLTEDLKYRPNKYFHQIEQVEVTDQACTVRYQRALAPVEGELRMEQVHQVLLGVLDAQQRVAHDQTFYLFPGVEAFGLDRRHNLRIGLINARPAKDRDCDPQEMNVDAFIRLLAAHCPEGHRRVVAYNKPILTLRHLRQILDHRPTPVLATALITLTVLGAVIFGVLHQYGPPRLRKPLQEWTANLVRSGSRFVRSGSDEWFAQIGEERRKREYRYPAVSLTLVLQPQVKTDEERQALFQFLNRLLATEFPETPYQLLIPTPGLSSKAYTRWKKVCQSSFSTKPCMEKSWMLQIKKYKGALRPLLGALREAMHQERANKPTVTLKYIELVGMANLTIKPPKQDNKTAPDKPPTTPKKDDKKNAEKARDNPQDGKAKKDDKKGAGTQPPARRTPERRAPSPTAPPVRPLTPPQPR